MTAREVADAHRRGWALVLAATARVARDLDLAEECVQEAYASALTAWTRDGVPANPEAWLTTAAKRRAVDAIRRETVLRSKLPLLLEPEEDTTAPDPFDDEPETEPIGDERLRLIFMCCHPALARDAQVALTLRLVCGLATPDIAAAFLVPEPTMAARLTRAKKKIALARIPFRMPSADELPERIDAVLAVVHLLYTAGHTAPTGATLQRADLVEQALHVARMLHELMPGEREVSGLLALLLATDARRATRTDADGRLLPLSEQDRSRWDRTALAEARDLILEAIRDGGPGRHLLQAGIAVLHTEAPSYADTDWPQIVRLYDALLTVWPSPVVALNRAVAQAEIDGPAAALEQVDRLDADGRLAGYRYLPAVRADLLRRSGRTGEAAAAYRQALALAENEAEREFLARRLKETG